MGGTWECSDTMKVCGSVLVDSGSSGYALTTAVDNNIVPGSCEAYFGNGFTRRVDLLPYSSSSGWFRCFYGETLPSSICEGGKVRMVPDRIKMSRGREKLEEVMGRGEGEEMPEFQDSAFEVMVGGGSRKSSRRVRKDFLDKYVPQAQGGINPHTMRELLQSVLVTEEESHCDETALFKGLSEEINCQGAPPHDLWNDWKTAQLSEFGEMVRAAFGFPVNQHGIENAVLAHNVLCPMRRLSCSSRHHGKTRIEAQQRT